jgi:hypothetical protein
MDELRNGERHFKYVYQCANASRSERGSASSVCVLCSDNFRKGRLFRNLQQTSFRSVNPYTGNFWNFMIFFQ